MIPQKSFKKGSNYWNCVISCSSNKLTLILAKNNMFVSILVLALLGPSYIIQHIHYTNTCFPYLILRATYRFSALSNISQLFCSNPNLYYGQILKCYFKTLLQLPLMWSKNKETKRQETCSQRSIIKKHSLNGIVRSNVFTEICRNIGMIITIDVFLYCLFIWYVDGFLLLVFCWLALFYCLSILFWKFKTLIKMAIFSFLACIFLYLFFISVLSNLAEINGRKVNLSWE